MKIVLKTGAILAALGALNWGLVVFDFNLIEKVLGQWPTAVKIIYGLIGISGIIAFAHIFAKK